MREYEEIHSVEELEQWKQGAQTLVYVSRENCSVCHALLPKVQELMEDYSSVRFGHLSADDVEEAAGQLTIFSIPAILAFSEGRELYREARFIRIDDLDHFLSKWTADAD
ncbi:thioredoxin family protein [Jeotgalibacillus aurantiacus]|uniref:thioredoxin family protein n=1 Tax=Jeotgalibacillus aurantiacus TaxID=2763266 RepID=UPI001D0B1350|nr:thioredoxin family protein [Jeotgalibacillus aurantiacus]